MSKTTIKARYDIVKIKGKVFPVKQPVKHISGIPAKKVISSTLGGEIHLTHDENTEEAIPTIEIMLTNTVDKQKFMEEVTRGIADVDIEWCDKRSGDIKNMFKASVTERLEFDHNEDGFTITCQGEMDQ